MVVGTIAFAVDSFATSIFTANIFFYITNRCVEILWLKKDKITKNKTGPLKRTKLKSLLQNTKFLSTFKICEDSRQY